MVIAEARGGVYPDEGRTFPESWNIKQNKLRACVAHAAASRSMSNRDRFYPPNVSFKLRLCFNLITDSDQYLVCRYLPFTFAAVSEDQPWRKAKRTIDGMHRN